MRSSNVNGVCKALVAFAGVCAALFCIWKGLRYALSDDYTSYKGYARVMMHELYGQESIDALFCGASLCYRGFDTGLLDRELGKNCFNAGSTIQGIPVSYCLLKDVFSRTTVGHVYLELEPAVEIRYDYRGDPDVVWGIYFIADNMKWGVPKLELLLKGTGPEYYASSFLVARRYWQKAFYLGYVKRNIQAKGTRAYREYGYDLLRSEAEWYVGKGYVANGIVASEDMLDDIRASIVYKVNEGWISCVNRIIALCREKGVEITLVRTPVSGYVLSRWASWYDDYHNMISDIADRNGVDYWDFTLVKDEYFTPEAGLFSDSTHLNMYGARQFSTLFARVVRGELAYDDICCRSADEKLGDGS